MKNALFIARRMSVAGGGGKSSPAVKVAVISVALSIFIMLMAISIVQGFRQEIRDRITGFNAHIVLTPVDPADGPIIVTPELDKLLKSQPYIRHVAYTGTVPVLLKTRDTFKGVYLKGIGADYDDTFVRKNLQNGDIPQGGLKGNVLISQATAEKLGVQQGDTINTYIISSTLKAKPMRVAAVFNTHFDVHDGYYAYADIDDVRGLLDLEPRQVSMIELTTSDLRRVPEYTTSLIGTINHAIDTGTIDQGFYITTVLEQGANYFAWLDLLDTNVYIILTLMTIVSAFTLIAGMLIIILEKVRVIGVMRALGMSRSELRHIFILMAVRIGLHGLAVGNAMALALILLQSTTHIIPLNPEAYYIDFMPVSLSPISILLVNAAFILIIYLALILPSQFAGRISPTESMRFDD